MLLDYLAVAGNVMSILTFVLLILMFAGIFIGGDRD